AEKLQQNKFTLADYYDQLVQLRGMGGIGELAGMLPGMDAKALQGAAIDESALTKTEAIILSMTPYERENPSCLGSSRKKRIARGAGTEVVEINRLLKQFSMMQTMAKQMSGGKMNRAMKKGKKGGFLSGLGF
ncbi:MAG: signal recognition particle protein, partial [Oscillospiraceae bacterium]|nr:signal recognition particle protein [Oscillospiraceae bacterium]